MATAGSAQTIIYNQAPYGLGDSNWNFDFSSSNGITVISNGTTYGPFGPFISYDDFTLASAAQVEAVNWQGLTVANPSFGLGYQGTEPSTFTINFRSDNAGLPGTLINSQTVSATKTFVDAGDIYDDVSSINIYSYSATLTPTPLR